MRKLITEKGKLENEVEKLRQTSPRSLWLSDLDALEKELDALDQMDEEAAEEMRARAEEMRARREAYGRIGFVRRVARKGPSKKIAEKTQKVEHATSEIGGNAPEHVMAKRTAPRKKPAKKAIASGSDDEEEGVPGLKKECLAAYSVNDPSPDQSVVETEITEDHQKVKKGRKKPGVVLCDSLPEEE
ncbi:hypothetical protein BAE44_0014015 [Dichanthelium oligosanthes]|uniref:Uncharacterized protein n=1 Tax=Dichanthelium oligosanthes TaxID=888268 RepID=A0A1E5VIM8_9POAL|nr:hypothetical protein BAE44_0014015 [Dichanthelium oligosanthes]